MVMHSRQVVKGSLVQAQIPLLRSSKRARTGNVPTNASDDPTAPFSDLVHRGIEHLRSEEASLGAFDDLLVDR